MSAMKMTNKTNESRHKSTVAESGRLRCGERLRRTSPFRARRISPSRLSEFRGRPVILAFYPADWSPVCGDQMSLYNEMISEFQEFGAEFWAFRLTARGAMPRFPGIASCIFRFWPILSQREK